LNNKAAKGAKKNFQKKACRQPARNLLAIYRGSSESAAGRDVQPDRRKGNLGVFASSLLNPVLATGVNYRAKSVLDRNLDANHTDNHKKG
jgi:hypothetical protein